jgi:hypothetical protein
VPKLGMLNLLQVYRREDYEDLTLGNLIWHFLLFYRPQNDINIPWRQRRISILRLLSMVLPFFDNDNPYRAEILFLAVKLCYDQEVLQYILRTTNGYIDLKPLGNSSVHEAMHRRLLERDSGSMKLIVKKTKNLHRCEAISSRDPQTETPTMVAMYDMNIFLAWREMLHDLGHETTTFVEQELKEGALKDRGWTSTSLCELFETQILPDPYYGPTIFGFLNCERCGHSGTMCFRRLKVDLVWRRYLRDMRNKHLIMATEVDSNDPDLPSTNPVSKSSQLDQEESPSSRQDASSINRRELPYRIVCSDECQDGICVAWVYEDETDIEPDLPPYCSGSPAKDDDAEEVTSVAVRVETCPTDSMPGAFKD